MKTPSTTESAVPSRASLASALAERGVRLTRQRQILIELMEKAEDHLQASDLLRLARERDPGIDRATVYRTLALLKSMGMVEELDLLHLDGHEHYYELRGRTDHVHIGCLRCGRIREYESDLQRRLVHEIQKQTGWAVRGTKIEVGAVCPECQAAPDNG